MLKSTRIIVSTLILLTLLLSNLPSENAVAHAGSARTASGKKSEMPAKLQDIFLAATSKPFTYQEASYTTEYNGLNYAFNASGLHAQGNGFQWHITLSGIGRSSLLIQTTQPQIVQIGNRLEYQRSGFTEWYRNTDLGVEQGFTIFEAPQGNGKLVLQFNLSTDLASSFNPTGRGLSFTSATGQVLHYDDLKAYDANGVELEAEMLYMPKQIVFQVEERNAAYPLTIDPLIYVEQKVTAYNGAANDYLGASVAIDGNTALVGAPGDDVGANGDQGSVYVFIRNGTTWELQQQLIASDGAKNNYFGHSVAISGDTALVGVPDENNSKGSTYVFVRSGSTWTQQQKLIASDGAENDNFGMSVALSGETALVGAHWDSIGANSYQGSAYVFTRSGTTWTEQQKLTAFDGAVRDYFGASVALSGDTALVGALSNDVGANIDQGSAYLFTRSGSIWSLQQKLTASDGVASDRFGNSVALSDNTALIGAELDDIGANVDQGSAYVFTLSGITWSEQQKLTASDGDTEDLFGITVALSNDTALVGAFWDDVGANVDQGSAYIFTRNGSSWSQMKQLTASDGTANDYFGSAAISGDTVLVGAFEDSVSANKLQGSAYFYQAYSTVKKIFFSQSAYDGWVLESGEFSNKGGLLNAGATTFYLGDNAQNKQYRAILSFNTAGLPDNAVITRVTLKIRKQGLVGTNPFNTHLGLKVDIRKFKFSTLPKLQLADFSAIANKNVVGTFIKTPVNNWYRTVLTSTAYPFVNLKGITQFRLRFAKDDNNDNGADYMKFFSGNAAWAYKPQVIVEYYVP